MEKAWDDLPEGGRIHVLGAWVVLDKILQQLHRTNQPPSRFMRFLYNTFLYLDVLSSLSSGEDPCSLRTICSATSPPSSLDDTPSKSFSVHNEIDSLLGCAGDLFPLIARMSKVTNQLNRKHTPEAAIVYIDERTRVREKLRRWQPPDISILKKSSDIHCSIDDIVRTAEIYRLTALLHLYRVCPPIEEDVDGFADQILDYLILIPKESGSLILHIWPLVATGCEQFVPTKRALVLERFMEVREKVNVANVHLAIILLQEVWRRNDAGDRNVGWVSLAREWGWHLLLG